MAERKLTLKQERWIVEYLKSGNRTDAARKAGYRGSDTALSVIGFQNLRNPRIQAQIQNHRREVESGGLREVDNRITGYLHRLEQFAEIVRERRADPVYGEIGDLGAEPGAKSGWLARKVRISRRFDKDSGDLIGETVDVEYKFDAGLAREMRELEKQTSIELHQWAEKRELSGADGGPMTITQIEVLKQILPPEVIEANDKNMIEGEYTESDVPPSPIVQDVAPVDDSVQVAVFEGWGSVVDDDD